MEFSEPGNRDLLKAAIEKRLRGIPLSMFDADLILQFQTMPWTIEFPNDQVAAGFKAKLKATYARMAEEIKS